MLDRVDDFDVLALKRVRIIMCYYMSCYVVLCGIMCYYMSCMCYIRSV